MQEILFRGKRVDNGEWVEGDLRQDKDLGTCYIGGWTYYGNSEGLQREPFEYEVIPETVGQYIGLRDKDYKRIWDGDIVLQPVRETRKHSPCIIEFRNGCFMAHYKSGKRYFDRYYNINTYTKVIGNVHDNPELLEGDG